MRVAIASSGLGHVARGIEAWASDVAAALHERGVKVVLCKGAGRPCSEYECVLPSWEREARKTKVLLNCLPRGIGWRIGLSSAYDVEQVSFACRLIRFLRKERIDILHVQDPLVALLVQRAETLGLVRARTILGHGTEESIGFQRKITYLQHLAPWHLEESRAAGAWKPTWTAIPNFLDTQKYSPGGSSAIRAELAIPPDDLVVLSVAAIKRTHKRIDWLLSEFAAMRKQRPNPPVWLVVAGGWEPDTPDLLREATRLLGHQVKFLIRFPRERMPELYRAADVFALCSLKEMMPVALLEAIASGLPPVVHTHPILQWMVGPGGTSVDMRTSGELSAALSSLLCDPALRQRSALSVRNHCVENFSKERIIDQILEYYRQVLAGSPSQPAPSRKRTPELV